MNDKSNCPPKQTLIDFLLGKLEPSQVATCEQHLNDCKPCGDTIRGLDANDTFVGLASNSNPSFSDADANRDSDQLVVKMLIDKMQEMQPTRSSTGKQTASSPSRADEVTNLLQPTGNSESIGRLAHYEIHELLGVGATSVVFRARDEQLHRDVALKVLRPSLGEGARERFLAEARAAAALNHENITTIYQVATEGHLAFMAQQWLPGETLEERLQREPELEIEEIKSISIQVADGLAAAHAKNLIHRDIKPANIWIDSERNRAIILDFGLVRVADDEPQMTETGMIAGTPNYMSPEQTRGSEVDSRSDLFSLGCVMYRLCSGRLPFQAGNTLATLQAIQNDSSPPPRHLNMQIPAELSELVMMLLSKDIDGRPRSADQVATALQDSTVMRELLVDRKQHQVSSGKQKSPPLRRWWLWGAAATLLFALLLLTGPQIIRVVTNHGVLEIETDDPDIAVEVLQGGERVYLIDEQTGQRLEIAAGTYKIQPIGNKNSFDLSQDTLTMKRGGKVVVTVTKLATGEAEQALTDPADLNRAIEKDTTDFESGRSTVSVQRANDIYEQIVNRIHQVKLERETAEATLDWESAISATETLVEINKTLVSTAIELRELGEMTPVEVDVVKQELLHENSRLLKLKQSHPSQVPIRTLEQQYEIALEKYDRLELQFKAGALEGEKFWPSQLELYEAEANLHEARKHFDQAIYALQSIIGTRQTILDSVVQRREAGLPSETGFVEAKIDLENAKARLRDFATKYGLVSFPVDSPQLNQSPPTDNTELTYDGRTFDQWLTVLDTERSPDRLMSALNAIKQLGQERDSRRAVDAIMRIARVFGNDQAFELTKHAREIFANIPKEIVIDAVLRELKVKNQNSGDFLTTFPHWYLDPASHDEFAKIVTGRSAELQQTLFEIIDSDLASESREHLEWSVNLLAELLTWFDFFKPDNNRALVERIKRSVPLITNDYAKITLVRYLAKCGEETTEYEDMLLDVLLPKVPSPHFGFLSPHRSLVLDTLKELGKHNTTDKTIDTVSKMLSDDKYWPTGFGSLTADVQPNDSKIRAIELMGSLGENAANALPVLQKIVERRDLYCETALQSIIQIAVPEHAREDALALQGKWKPVKTKGDDAKRVGSSEVVFRGLHANQYFRGLGGGAGLSAGAGGGGRDVTDPRLREETPWMGMKTIEFTEQAGELDFLHKSAGRVKGIYELKGDVLKLCLAENAESSRPTSFDNTEAGQVLIALERLK